MNNKFYGFCGGVGIANLLSSLFIYNNSLLISIGFGLLTCGTLIWLCIATGFIRHIDDEPR